MGRLKDVPLTPGLYVHGDNRFGNSLGLGSLLLSVSSKALLTDANSLSILLLVVGAEQVDIIVVLLSSSTLGGVDGEVARLGAVGGVGLGGITRESGKLALIRGDVLVPSGGVGVLVGDRRGADGLVDGDISLRGAVAICTWSVRFLQNPWFESANKDSGRAFSQRCIAACCFVCWRVLSPPLKHGPIFLIMQCRKTGERRRRRGKAGEPLGENLPYDVGAGRDPAVEHWQSGSVTMSVSVNRQKLKGTYWQLQHR